LKLQKLFLAFHSHPMRLQKDVQRIVFIIVVFLQFRNNRADVKDSQCKSQKFLPKKPMHTLVSTYRKLLSFIHERNFFRVFHHNFFSRARYWKSFRLKNVIYFSFELCVEVSLTWHIRNFSHYLACLFWRGWSKMHKMTESREKKRTKIAWIW
jgi:hypothetical protein